MMPKDTHTHIFPLHLFFVPSLDLSVRVYTPRGTLIFWKIADAALLSYPNDNKKTRWYGETRRKKGYQETGTNF